jgi:D-cysteine desulfhydrase
MKDTRVIGIPICDSSQFFRDTVTKLVKEFNDQFHCEVCISEYDMWDEFIGPGSGIPYKEQIECMKSLAREEGIFLDPVYTGKAFYGLEQKIKDGYFKEGSKILFIHSGGIFGLLAQHTSFYPM